MSKEPTSHDRLGRLLLKLWSLLLRAARYQCRNEQTAEDAASEVLIGVVRSPDFVLKHKESIDNGYLPGKLRLRVREKARQLQRQTGVSLEQLNHEIEPETAPIVEFEPSPVAVFVQSLPDLTDREIVQMRANGLNQIEIAKALKMGPRAVRYRNTAIEEKAEKAGLTPTWRPPRQARAWNCG